MNDFQAAHRDRLRQLSFVWSLFVVGLLLFVIGLIRGADGVSFSDPFGAGLLLLTAAIVLPLAGYFLGRLHRHAQ